MNKDITARHRKGIHRGVIHNKKLIMKRLGAHLGRQFLAQVIYIGGKEGVFDQRDLLLNFQKKLFADLPFLFNAQAAGSTHRKKPNRTGRAPGADS